MPRLLKEFKLARGALIEKCYGIGECGNPQRAKRVIKHAKRRAGKARKYLTKIDLEDIDTK